jgi:hypothetical protein
MKKLLIGLLAFCNVSLFAQQAEFQSAIVTVGKVSTSYQIKNNEKGIPSLFKDNQDTGEEYAEMIFSYKTGEEEHLFGVRSPNWRPTL